MAYLTYKVDPRAGVRGLGAVSFPGALSASAVTDAQKQWDAAAKSMKSAFGPLTPASVVDAAIKSTLGPRPGSTVTAIDPKTALKVAKANQGVPLPALRDLSKVPVQQGPGGFGFQSDAGFGPPPEEGTAKVAIGVGVAVLALLALSRMGK